MLKDSEAYEAAILAIGKVSIGNPDYPTRCGDPATEHLARKEPSR
jgi:hypothetical protein